jgi:hypothetical protein
VTGAHVQTVINQQGSITAQVANNAQAQAVVITAVNGLAAQTTRTRPGRASMCRPHRQADTPARRYRPDVASAPISNRSVPPAAIAACSTQCRSSGLSFSRTLWTYG